MPPKNFNPKTTTWSGARRQEAQELSGDPKRLRAKNREVHRQYSNVGYNTPVSASVSQGGADSSYVGFVSHARVSVDFLGKVVATAFNPEYVGMLLDNKYITPDQARWCISMCSYAGVIPPYNLVEHAATDSETGEAVNPTEKSNARMETCYTMGLNFRGKKAPQEFIEWCRRKGVDITAYYQYGAEMCECYCRAFPEKTHMLPGTKTWAPKSKDKIPLPQDTKPEQLPKPPTPQSATVFQTQAIPGLATPSTSGADGASPTAPAASTTATPLAASAAGAQGALATPPVASAASMGGPVTVQVDSATAALLGRMGHGIMGLPSAAWDPFQAQRDQFHAHASGARAAARAASHPTLRSCGSDDEWDGDST